MNIENIYFDFNKSYIRPDAEVELDKLVQIMKENPVKIELGTYTDSRGSDEYNLELSQKRAESVVRYIVQQGVASERISAKGYGEIDPINGCSNGVPCSPAQHQANRRAEFKVTGFNSVNATGDFDLNKFVAGDEIPVYMFDKDFYINCLQSNQIADAGKVPVKVTPPAEPAKAAAKTTPPTKPANTAKADPVVTAEKPGNKQSEKTTLPKTQAILYRVQVFSLSRLIPLNSAEFDNLRDIQSYEEDGLYKYTAGVFGTYEEARTYRDIMINDGFPDSFVVKFENGKHVNMAQANK
jgi:hypothetical protein